MNLGPYRLDRALGTGGMAEVWLATHELTGKEVAVKILNVSSNELFREARAHARLNHPHIVRLFDYGEANQQPYLSMEAMEGTLRDLLPFRSLESFVEVMLQVLQGLAFAHSHGVIHRDLKPENILYSGGEKPLYKLADFGIAQALGDIARNDVYQSSGTPVYMAPEQFFGSWQDIGPWSDLYALGCMAYELITGRVPFESNSLAKLAFQHLHEPLAREATLFPIPTALWEWIERMTAKMPEDRISHAADASAWLRVALQENVDPQTLARYVPETESFLPTLQLGEFQLPAELPSEPFAPSGQTRASHIRHEVPRTWRSDTAEHAQPDTDGLGLFALREVPIVGRMHARDVIWKTLKEVVDHKTLKQVWLHTANLNDADQLAIWTSRHASEQGIVQVFSLTQTPSLNPHDGFVGLAEALLRARRLTAEQTSMRGSKFGKDGDVLAALLLARIHGQMDQLPGMAATFVSTARLLARASLDRPVILLVSGAQWDEDIGDWLRNLHIECENHSVMVLVSTHEQPPENTTVIALPPSTIQDMHELLNTLLPLDAKLREHIVRISGEDGEFARQILTDLVERRATIRGADHRLKLNENEFLPDSPRELFARRLDRVLRLHTDNPQIANATLELAVVLGIAPDPKGFARLCQRARVPVPTTLLTGMLDAGLLQGDEDRWYLSHPALLECIKQRALLNQRWTDWNALAAELFLEDVGHDTSSETWAQIARLFREAEQPLRALAPLYRATINQTRSVKASNRYRDLRAAVLLETGTAMDSADGVLQLHLDALIQQHQGNVSEAVETLRKALDICATGEASLPKPGFEYAQAMCLKQLGIAFIALGDERGTDVFTASCESFARLGDSLEEANCAGYLGFLYTQHHDTERAESFYRIAIAGYRLQGSQKRAATLAFYLAHNLASQKRFEEALDCLKDSVISARQSHDHYGEFLAEQSFGEIYRFSFDFEKARQHLNAAWTLATNLVEDEKTTCQYSLAALELAQGNADIALNLLQDISNSKPTQPIYFRVALQLARAQSKDQFDSIEEQWQDSTDNEIQWLLKVGRTLISDL